MVSEAMKKGMQTVWFQEPKIKPWTWESIGLTKKDLQDPWCRPLTDEEWEDKILKDWAD